MFLDCSPNVLAVPVKICRKCREVKPRTEFGVQKSHEDGLRSWCKDCRNEDSRRLYREDLDKQRERKRRWLEANPGYNHRYYEANAEKIKERISLYQRANSDEIRDRNRRWRDANREKERTYHRNRRARKSGNGGTHTDTDLAAIRAAQTDAKGRLICWRCGEPIKGTPHLDHWIPLAGGGTNDAGNLHYMHAHCNLTKSSKHPTEIGRLL